MKAQKPKCEQQLGLGSRIMDDFRFHPYTWGFLVKFFLMNIGYFCNKKQINLYPFWKKRQLQSQLSLLQGAVGKDRIIGNDITAGKHRYSFQQSQEELSNHSLFNMPKTC